MKFPLFVESRTIFPNETLAFQVGKTLSLATRFCFEMSKGNRCSVCVNVSVIVRRVRYEEQAIIEMNEIRRQLG